MDVLNDAIVNLVLALFGVLVLYVTSLVRAKLKGTKYEFLTSLAIGGIAYAEEKGAAAIKRGSGKLPSGEKRRIAMQYVLNRAPGISPEEATEVVESRLPQAEIGAAGFIQATAQAIKTP